MTLPRPIGQYPQVNDDLVPSYHLLLCCVDMLFCSALAKKDLLNPACPFLPEGIGEVDFVAPMDGILTQLCSKYNGMYLYRSQCVSTNLDLAVQCHYEKYQYRYCNDIAA